MAEKLYTQADLEAFEKRVQRESYGAARILWTAGICDLLKIPKPKPDESGLEWVLREGSRALEALLREAELKGRIAQLEELKACREGAWFPDAGTRTINDRIAELEKARGNK